MIATEVICGKQQRFSDRMLRAALVCASMSVRPTVSGQVQAENPYPRNKAENRLI